jgi:hypothetical protein
MPFRADNSLRVIVTLYSTPIEVNAAVSAAPWHTARRVLAPVFWHEFGM